MVMLRCVQTRYGALQGIACGDPRVTVFKGVPFAKPPVGDLRWAAPQKPEPWEGVKIADTFKPIPWQGQPGLNVGTEFYDRELNPTAAEYVRSEDCLYLNVWTPAKTEDDKLPVYIWIHGGGYNSGYSYEMEFDGERLARQGIIFVTVAYRLNIFGFLAHPELKAESADGSVGNYGMQDQTAAIAWVKENIAAFGGDPERITIGGQSAGAGSVLCQMISPASKGLFERAITQSGGGLRTWGYGAGFRYAEPAMQDGVRFLEALGVQTIEEARKLPPEVIFEANRTFRSETKLGPTVDGVYLLEDALDAFLGNRQHEVDYLCGYNLGERPQTPASGSIPKSVEEFAAIMKERYGETVGAALVDAAKVENAEDLYRLYKTDLIFHNRALGTRLWAEAQKKTGRKTWLYQFDVTIPGEDQPGSFHGAEMWFTFHSLNRCWRPFTGMHYDRARQISGYWVNFVKTGDPNGCDMFGEPLPEWKISDEETHFQLLEDEIRGEEGFVPSELMKIVMDYRLGE